MTVTAAEFPSSSPSGVTLAHVDEGLVKRLEMCTTLPSPPSVATRIIELGQDPDVDLGEVAKVVSMDPALASKILRIANSPLYARRRKTNNLRQAFIALGLNGAITLALSFSLANAMSSSKPQGLNHRLFWIRSLTGAVASRALAAHHGCHGLEEYFLAGLLQNLGMLALDQVAPDLYAECADQQVDEQSMREAELATLGVDHAAVGAWLLEQWNLPESLRVAVACSHLDYVGGVAQEHRVYADCVAVSAAMTDIWLDEGREGNSEWAAQLADARLRMGHEDFMKVLEEVSEHLPEAAATFEVDLYDGLTINAILEKSKEILLMRNLQAVRQTERLQRTAATLETRTRELEENSRRDGLTGIFNRRYLDEYLEKEFEQAKAHGWPLSIAFVDLDHFKQVNDTYGHQAGDLVLQGAADVLQDSVRPSDVVARYGGEEFVVLLCGTDRDGANEVARRLVETFRAKSHDVGNERKLTVTASIGVATFDSRTTYPSIEDLMKAADEAVYKAKSDGRDRYVIHEG